MKWYIYWAALVSCLLGVLYTKNKKMYSDKPRQWYIGKSLIECVLLVIAAAFMPAILVVYASMMITKNIQRPAFRIGVGFVVGTVLMMTMGWILELLVLVGAFAINLVSDDFLGFMAERKQKRGVAFVMDGKTA